MPILVTRIKQIKDYDGYYISRNGEVYCDLGRGSRDKSKRVALYKIKPRLTKNGYCRIYARQTSTGKRMDLYIHRLVAEYFIPNPHNKKYVNHKNCIRNDNRADNLEWVTAKENTDQSMRLKHVIRDKLGRYAKGIEFNNIV